VAFQTGRKDQSAKNGSHFDLCDLEDVKFNINSKYYPYDNLNGNKSLPYDLYSRFQSSNYLGSDDQPCLDKDTFIFQKHQCLLWTVQNKWKHLKQELWM